MKIILKLRFRVLFNRYKELPKITQVVYPFAIIALAFALVFVSGLIMKQFNLFEISNRSYLYVYLLSLFLIFYPHEFLNVYKKMFQFSDMELLLTSPVSTRSVFLIKNLEMTFSFFLLFLVLFVPIQLYQGVSNYVPFYYPIIVVYILFLLCNFIMSITQLIMIVLVRLVKSSYRKEIITFLSGCIGFFIYSIFYLSWKSIDFKALFSKLETENNPFLYVIKTAYLSLDKSLYDVVSAKGYLLTFTIIVVATLIIVILLTEYFYKMGWIMASEAKNRGKAKSNRNLNKYIFKNDSMLINISVSLVLKDIKILFRDFKLWDAFIAPLILFMILSYSSYLEGRGKYIFFLFIIFSIWTSYRISLNMILTEGKNIFIICVAPVDSKRIVVTKATGSLCISAIMMIVSCILIITVFKQDIYIAVICYIASFALMAIISFLCTLYGYTNLEYIQETEKLKVTVKGNLKLLAFMIGLVIFFLLSFIIFMILTTKVSFGNPIIKYVSAGSVVTASILMLLFIIIKKIKKLSLANIFVVLS